MSARGLADYVFDLNCVPSVFRFRGRQHVDVPLPLPEYPAFKFRATLPNKRRPTLTPTYEAVTCTVCAQVHLVNPVTGKMAGQDE